MNLLCCFLEANRGSMNLMQKIKMGKKNAAIQDKHGGKTPMGQQRTEHIGSIFSNVVNEERSELLSQRVAVSVFLTER